MPSKGNLTHHWPVFLLLSIQLGSAILVPILAFQYVYDTSSRIAAGLAFALLLAALGATWLVTRATRRTMAPAGLDKTTLLGLVLGFVWVVEISINNVATPPVQARDRIDNVFWALIAAVILAASIAAAYRSGRVREGITAGTWSGFVSGVVSCGMALSLIVLGMPLILHDPVNRAEWASRGPDVTAPTMAAYFAFETLAGALLHLTAAGVVMGFVLGVAGSLLGKIAKRATATRP